MKKRRMKKLTRLQLFQEMYNMATHNLLCYSKNYLMTEPKEQYIKQWEVENEKVNLLKEIIKEEEQKESVEKVSFTLEQILKVYTNTQYYVRNGKGELLIGTFDFKEAKKYAEKYKKEYLQDFLNTNLGVNVYDKEGKKVYSAKGKQKEIKKEETEEFE